MTSKATDSHSSNAVEPGDETQGKIRRRAYEIYLGRGEEPGHDLEDWLQAERELATGESRAAGE